MATLEGAGAAGIWTRAKALEERRVISPVVWRDRRCHQVDNQRAEIIITFKSLTFFSFEAEIGARPIRARK
ncbi:hypothetical protein [Mesorhizobium sp. M0589]|uniref:hypothetical protein n=1 Tax=unclassified Mesorhizobium TaxID=325217 RepID=UPI003337F454